ncbi:unnamed protein product [Callosobruchus maculatus]|uniref:NIF3-like protein 1 n=1 Tax=Callosobruchus maculatus TaxID=64391 RepID=A0A653D6K6_CALMS|nr:unnamed protein product [Callosobruchus maculatus]
MGVPLRDVLSKLQEIAPLKLAESWDNVGLLVEPEKNPIIKNVLLTIDLTEDVVDEALEVEAGLIISYHPNIFRPIKTVTQSHWKERIITKCIKNDIAVFSPHTSWDAIKDGVNDWLCTMFKTKSSKPILPNSENPTIGMGRLLDLEFPITLTRAINLIKQHLGLGHVRVGLGKHKSLDTDFILTVAVCAGSGGSVLNGIEADLYLTGEMMHHDVLEATQKGITVVLCNHSNSERGYLTFFQQRFTFDGLKVIVSKVDKDCLQTV